MKNMMVLLVMFILGGQVMGQVIPTKYQNQEKYPHKYFEYCQANIGNNGLMVNPFQIVEMTSPEEVKIYNQVKNSNPNRFVQGVVIIPSGTYIIFTYKHSDGTYKVVSIEKQNW
jgi:hypothetical protein